MVPVTFPVRKDLKVGAGSVRFGPLSEVLPHQSQKSLCTRDSMSDGWVCLPLAPVAALQAPE